MDYRESDNHALNAKSERVTKHETPAEAEYWASFYDKVGFTNGSSFSEFLNETIQLPDTVIDIGCGDGRDSFAFARDGKRVIGLDRSEVGVAHGTEKAANANLKDTLSFAVCDVSNDEQLSDLIAQAREAAEGETVCFYMRFFLHSIPEDVQEKLLTTIANSAKPGDVFAAEFRTDKDEDRDKAFGNSHYRRYQNAVEFSFNLSQQYGWDVAYEIESDGLSPYKDEDPTLYRVIAVKG